MDGGSDAKNFFWRRGWKGHKVPKTNMGGVRGNSRRINKVGAEMQFGRALHFYFYLRRSRKVYESRFFFQFWTRENFDIV